MKNAFLLFGLLVASQFSAQNISLEQEWPSPRLGDVIEFSAQKQTPSGTKEIGEFEFANLTNDTGWINVGPLSIKVADTLYRSDSIRIHVIDSLPAMRYGFWFRFETINGELFLVTEQRLSLNTSIRHVNERDLFATIDCYRIKERGLKITNHRSTWSHKAANIGGVVHFIPYMLVMYKIETGSQFDGEYTFQKEDFEMWPEDVVFPQMIIKN